MSEHDPGDEDDIERCPDKHWKSAIMGWRFRYGGVQCFYPAIQLPPMEDHDAGDEEPRMALDPKLVEYFNAIEDA